MKNLVCELTIREVPVPPERVREWRASLRSLMELLVEADMKRKAQAEPRKDMRDERSNPDPAPTPGTGPERRGTGGVVTALVDPGKTPEQTGQAGEPAHAISVAREIELV